MAPTFVPVACAFNICLKRGVGILTTMRMQGPGPESSPHNFSEDRFFDRPWFSSHHPAFPKASANSTLGPQRENASILEPPGPLTPTAELPEVTSPSICK